MGSPVGFRHCTVGQMGYVQDIPSHPGTLGWEGQWDSGLCALGHWDTSSNSRTLGLEGQRV